MRNFCAASVFLAFVVAGTGRAEAQSVDLVVTIQSDQPAYMAQDLEHFKVTISNNGPATATSVQLAVHHPAAAAPFELSATCQALPGANPNGPAVCPGGSGTAPSPAFVRSGTSFSVSIPSIPSQSQVLVEFDNAADCISEQGPAGGQDRGCYRLPQGNFTVLADVSSAQSETDDTTNHATTNIYLYPPDIQYKIEITDAPTSAIPGEIVEYDFEVISFGLHPSNRLSLLATIKGLTGTMTAMSPSNNPYGNNASTLPGTELVSITCLSPSLGGYPLPMVFGSLTDYCSAPPIPLPNPTSFTNSPPISGFPGGHFLENLPGTQDGPSSGGVMRFRATVKVGYPLCVVPGESGYRELEFLAQVSGLSGTDTVPPAFGDNTATAVTQVAKNCNEEADVQFTTAATPATVALNGGSGTNGGSASWTQTVTVSNISTGSSAATATLVPVNFGHHSYLFTETRTPVTCTSSQPGLCPTATNVGTDTPTAFRLTTTLPSLPPGQSVTFSQDVVATRTACWGLPYGFVDLRGDAGPSPAVYDPNYLATDLPPLNYTSGSNTYFGNNGMQTIATITNIPVCPGGGGTTPDGVDLRLVKSGPYASAADAASNGPLIGQSAGNAIADGTTIYFKLQATNPDGASPVMVDYIQDTAPYVGSGLMTADAGFIHSGPLLGNWGIGCTASPASQTCHELASSFTATGYNNSVRLDYDPTLHGGDTAVPLAPYASLTYILPFVTPTHLNRCTSTSQVQNSATARFGSASGGWADTPVTNVTYFVGNPPCTPGTLDIDKTILPPATATSIPVSGLITHRLLLSNFSSTDTLDIAHLIDSPSAFGATLQVINITCQSVSNGAQCPVAPIVAGIKTPISGAPTALPNPFDIDYEWGSAGNNTFPPNSSLEVNVTYKLSNPTRAFGCLFNNAQFSAEHDALPWIQDGTSVSACPPQTPDLSLQKTVSPQIAPPGSMVTYTLIVTNIGGASADGTQLVDPLPAALLADNPSGYTNVTCMDLSGSSFLPNPQGTAVCPSVTSNASGLSAIIATLGANSALKFTYQALMPDVPVAPLSVENTATVTPPAADGSWSFNSGTAQSHQNVQVTAEAAAPPASNVAALPAVDRWSIILLMLTLIGLGAWRSYARKL